MDGYAGHVERKDMRNVDGTERSMTKQGRGSLLRGLRQSRLGLWWLLALPWVLIVYRYADGTTYYGEFIHQTGRFSVWFLLLALAIAPLRLTFPRAGWTLWLMQRRRYFGIAVFAYALPHLVAYLIKVETMERIFEDAQAWEMLAGWLAMVIFFFLAVTSSNYAVRYMGRAWKRLHRWVHAGALLTILHWIFTAFDPFVAYVHLALLVLIEGWRLARRYAVRPATR